MNKLYCLQESGELYHGDCVEEMKKLTDESVDMVITSPPYNVGINYHNSDDAMPYNEYLAFVQTWLNECFRVLKDGGRIALNLPSSVLMSASSRVSYLSLDYVLIMRAIGFTDREWITWIKMPKGEIPGKSTAWGSWLSPSCPYLRDGSEFIIVMNKKSIKRTDKTGTNDMSKEEFLRWTTNVWYIQPEHDRLHPAPFPLELPHRLIKLYTWKGDVILDPFIGSGTTAIAAMRNKRQWIGIDISEKYHEIAKKRIKDERMLF